MVRGIIFDMDGVIIDSEPFYRCRRIDFLTLHGISIPLNIDLTGSNETVIWETLVRDNAQLREGLKLAYRDYRKQYPAPYKDLIDPQVQPLFTCLKQAGLLLAIASSSDADCIREIIVTAGIQEMVDYYISGETCIAHKPNPEIYKRALSNLDLSAEEALAIEDSAIGIAAAKNAGLRVYALRLRQSNIIQDQSQADRQLTTLFDILEFIPKI